MQSSRTSRRPTCRIPERQKKENSDWKHRILADTGYTSLFRVMPKLPGLQCTAVPYAYWPRPSNHISNATSVSYWSSLRLRDRKLGEHTRSEERRVGKYWGT